MFFSLNAPSGGIEPIFGRRSSWNYPIPLEVNNNWDEIGFEIDRITNVLSFLNEINKTIVVFYEPPRSLIHQSDFDWFISSNLDLDNYRGKYIAVYDKQIIGWGDTSSEALNMAKATNPESQPALTFIPESEDVIFWLYPHSRISSSAVAG